ncbi:MAG: NUDIX domain-containing protein [Fibrobacteres bacterium]|nr:NUDIX domain-containing protein [Fibrobacterota bacterium]
MSSDKSVPDLSQELLDVLDDLGQVIGTATRQEVHARGLVHRAVHILVLGSDNRLLLQKRSARKASWPGMWDTSVGGHVGAGEAPIESALRECREELGICVEAKDLEPLGRYLFDGQTLDPEWVDSWILVHDGPFSPDPEEVEAVAFLTASEVETQIRTGWTTPHFSAQWERDLKGRGRVRP